MSFSLQVKSVDGLGKFAGYASVFDVVDNQKDLMLKGAFADTLKQGVQHIKLLWQHLQSEPIGVFDRMFEDAYGLYVEGRLLLDVQKAKEAHALLKEGAISGLSIGYSPVKYRIDNETGVRLLAAVELWEVSLVTFPANAAANVTVVKSTPPAKAAVQADLVPLAEMLDKAIHTLVMA